MLIASTLVYQLLQRCDVLHEVGLVRIEIAERHRGKHLKIAIKLIRNEHKLQMLARQPTGNVLKKLKESSACWSRKLGKNTYDYACHDCVRGEGSYQFGELIGERCRRHDGEKGPKPKGWHACRCQNEAHRVYRNTRVDELHLSRSSVARWQQEVLSKVEFFSCRKIAERTLSRRTTVVGRKKPLS